MSLDPEAIPQYAEHHIEFCPSFEKNFEFHMDWFCRKEGASPIRHGNSIEPLINGQIAFKAVQDAILGAKHSVDIINWGFDPAMVLDPNKMGPDNKIPLRLGCLLAHVASTGVKVRVLVWKNAVANFLENTIIGDGVGGSGGSAFGSGMTDAKPAKQTEAQKIQLRITNLQACRNHLIKVESGELSHYPPGCARDARAEELAEFIRKEQAALDALVAHYNTLTGSGGTSHEPDEQVYTRNWFKRHANGEMPNLEFRTRDFDIALPLTWMSSGDQQEKAKGRFSILMDLFRDDAPDTGALQVVGLTLFASHHQKMVLVDYEKKSSSIGLIMCHNLHKDYWDTSAHHYDAEIAGRSPGFKPWQDLSTRVRGPLLYDLNQNFCPAWDRESHRYKNRSEPSLVEQRAALQPEDFADAGPIKAQLGRTQPQEGGESGDKSILDQYRKAIYGSYEYVYMENQYFRYPEFAELMRDHALKLKAAKCPRDLHLFVLTNAPNDSKFSSSTYDMLKELGQEQLMPQAQRTLAEKMLMARSELAQMQGVLPDDTVMARTRFENRKAKLEQIIADGEAQNITPDVESKLGELKPQEIHELASNTAKEDPDAKPYTIKEIPGLKVVIGTLTTCKPGVGEPFIEGSTALFRDIYIHSKLLVVDDVLSLLSSANINARSMHSDSELGYVAPNQDLAQKWRRELWGAHAGRSIEDENGKCDAPKNFVRWNEMMDKNWRNKIYNIPLSCHLTRFWDVETPYAIAVD